jgi:hypothetical protein
MRQSAEQRRLLAVLAGDIVGYSRLMAENEADMFHRLKDLQQSLIVPATARNNGRIVKWTGDGFLAVFESAVDAVRAAVEIQSGAAAAGSSASENRRIRFRIGINAGDVIVVPGDVYGDTVNVAARLEASPLPEASVSRAGYETRFAASSASNSQTAANSRSRTSPTRSARSMFASIRSPGRSVATGNRCLRAAAGFCIQGLPGSSCWSARRQAGEPGISHRWLAIP